jgi:V-type H+-transporting ATPase subunit a
MIDTYGVPSYREANPAVFTCISFPFFFGVMFGDIGHGSIIFFIALSFFIFRDYLEKIETLKPIVQARYCFLLMGFFATYMGFIYNEFMSIPTNIFGSCYDLKEA